MIEESWDSPVRAFENKDIYQLLQVSGDENQRLKDAIATLREQTFLETATGEELEKIGEFVGIRRKEAEDDAKLRFRIKAEFIAQASDTTYPTFVEATAEILQAEPGQFTIQTPPDTTQKVISLDVDGGILDSIPLTDSELADILNDMVSADARIDIVRHGNFAFAGDDSTLKGFNDGTWSEYI